jgi:hypothetical protein
MTKVIKPCLSSLKLIFYNVVFLIILEIINILNEIISSANKRNSIMLQLFIKFPDKPIF